MVRDTAPGTRGARAPRAGGPLGKWVMRQMQNWHRRQGFRFQGMDLLFLTTSGRKTGHPWQTPVAWFPDGPDAWLVAASANGSATNPGWFRNMVAHPDQVWIELPGRKLRVTPELLEGSRRDEAWNRIVAAQPRFSRYQAKTDRVLPVIRLTPAGDGPAPGSGPVPGEGTASGEGPAPGAGPVPGEGPAPGEDRP